MNLAMISLDRWFTANQLMLNTTKTKVIKFIPKAETNVPMDVLYKDHVLEEVHSTKFLGLNIDKSYALENSYRTIISQIECGMFYDKKLKPHLKY
jgi:hypothetical protein